MKLYRWIGQIAHGEKVIDGKEGPKPWYSCAKTESFFHDTRFILRFF